MRWLQIVALTLLIALGAACAAGDAADEPAVMNPSFDDWCKSELCGWQTNEGAVVPVSTWHKKDLGASFVETPTQVSQSVTAAPVGCFLIDTIADVETAARLSIRVDFNDDQVIDFEQQVPAVSWQSVPFPVRAPVDYRSVRFIVRKQGTGGG